MKECFSSKISDGDVMDVSWLIRFVIFMLTEWKISSALDCSDSESVTCRQEIQSLREEQSRYYYASDDRTLAEMCRKQILAINCVNSFAEECLKETEQTYFKTLVLGSDEFLDTLCFEDSELRKAYLQHSPCIRNITQELDNCSSKYQLSQKKLDSSEESSNFLLKKTCCIYFENIQCSTKVAKEVCGEDASRFVSNLLTLLSGTYLTQRCQPYAKHDPISCTSVSGGQLHLPQMTLFIFLFISSLVRLRWMQNL